MLFCPYCLRRAEPSNGVKEFTDIAGFFLTDDPNQKRLTLKVHSNGCGRVFVAISDIKKPERVEYLACFKLPEENWVKTIFSRSQI